MKSPAKRALPRAGPLPCARAMRALIVAALALAASAFDGVLPPDLCRALKAELEAMRAANVMRSNRSYNVGGGESGADDRAALHRFKGAEVAREQGEAKPRADLESVQSDARLHPDRQSGQDWRQEDWPRRDWALHAASGTE